MSWFVREYQPSVIFDVGANKGDYISMCRNSGFWGHIYGFEPNPKTFRTLEALSDDRSHFFNIGLSDQEGSFELFYKKGDDESTHATLYKASIENNSNITSAVIELKTLDKFIDEHQIEYIDLLKIDTEGNELKVLKGAKKSLEAKKIKAIQFEITGINVVSRVFFKDFFDLLSPQYRLYRLLPNSFLPIRKYDEALFLELFAYQNIIAIQKEHIK